MVKFDCSAEDSKLISEIATRYMQLRMLEPKDRLDVEMDITAVHCNGDKLRLADLLVASRFDLAHDIDGIRAFISRKTGCLYGNFIPRYAVKQ